MRPTLSNTITLPADRAGPARRGEAVPAVHVWTDAERDLWRRIAAFEVGDASWALPFWKRLARENGWSREFALRVVDEYRKFVFLAMAAGHPVTPSDEVDQAWHLHMVYTRSYWDDLCAGTLGRPLHHGPTKGGRAEGAKFHDWYAKTIESYAAFFGVYPPRDIWPASRERFSRAASFRRVNVAENVVIPRSPLRAVGVAVAACVAMLGVAGCSPAGMNTGEWVIVVAVVLVVVGLVVAAKFAKNRGTGADSSGCGAGTWFWFGDGGS
ncbi:MAG TPA: hypothetical protein VHN77_10205, partial [Phycisphaerales bacterium]|nr:hypothetical protein [Phycisphaerales bacterium]